jgi:hypothetical protein
MRSRSKNDLIEVTSNNTSIDSRNNEDLSFIEETNKHNKYKPQINETSKFKRKFRNIFNKKLTSIDGYLFKDTKPNQNNKTKYTFFN